MIQPERIQFLNDRPARAGRYVLYWMQQAQRAEWNHALEYAVREANLRELPVVVGFGLTDEFPAGNLRHYAFMLEGLCELRSTLERRGMRLVVRHERPDRAAVALSQEAALVVVDAGYLRVQREWRTAAAAALACRLVQVETDVIVPVATASGKEEYAAATLRPKLQRLLPQFLQPVRSTPVRCPGLGLALGGLDWGPGEAGTGDRRAGSRSSLAPAGERILAALHMDRSVPSAPGLRGGAVAAHRRLRTFLAHGLAHYADERSDPAMDWGSSLSAYLHFGQISPLEIACRVQASAAPAAAKAAFLEELIVRRELSMNFVHFQPQYDAYACLPAWARASLERHRHDPRPVLYTEPELEAGRTHDPYWNAAQLEMVHQGRMHGYMRMYWGKKVIEWTAAPETAFEILLKLNHKYELDGRDPNGFAGVAWCFGKHDRPWQERPVFGQVRYMNAAGLERKFDMAAYLHRTGAPATDTTTTSSKEEHTHGG